ncbi:hypothetical protein JCM5353_006777 [Sporobolomyces roseus]
MALKQGTPKLPHSVLHRITQFVSEGEVNFNRRTRALLEAPKLSKQTRHLLEKQRKDLGKALCTLRLVNKEFSCLAIEFMNFTISAKKVVACPEFRLGIAQRLRSRFRKVVFDVPYSSSSSTGNDFLIQLLPLFTNLSSIEFGASTGPIFYNYNAGTTQSLRLQQVEQRRRVLEHINPRISSVSFVGQALEQVIDLLRLFSKDHLLEIKLDWTVTSQVDSTKWEEFFRILPPSVRTLEIDRSRPKESSKNSEEAKKAKTTSSGTKEATNSEQTVAALSSYPKEWLIPSNWPSLKKLVLRLPNYTSIDHDFLAQFTSLEVLELHQTYATEEIDIYWDDDDFDLEKKLVAIPPLAQLRMLSLCGIHLLISDLLRHTLDEIEVTEKEGKPEMMEVETAQGLEGDKADPGVVEKAATEGLGEKAEEGGTEETQEAKEEEEERPPIYWSPSISRIIDPDSPFVIGCDSYLEEPFSASIHEHTSSRPFPKLVEFTVESVDPCANDTDLFDFLECHSSTLRRFNFYNSGRDWQAGIENHLASLSILQGVKVSTYPYHPEAHISQTFIGKRDTVCQHWFDKSHPGYKYYRKPKDDALIVKLRGLLEYGQERLKEMVEQVEKGGEAGDLYRFAFSLKPFELERAARYD